jgi:Big-like domain-containing protein
MTNRRRILVAVALASAALSCGEGSVIQPNPFYDIRIQVTPVSAVMFVGNTIPLTATLSALPAGADSGVMWSSSDTAVAKVDAAGRVTGLKVGVATIHATATATSHASASVVVSVQKPPSPVSGVTVTPARGEVSATSPLQLTATVSVASASISRAVTWRSDNPTVAVSSSGLVTVACDQAGTAIVTAVAVADTSARGSATVTVRGAAATPVALLSLLSQGGSVANPASLAGTIQVVVGVGTQCGAPPSRIQLVIGRAAGDTVIANISPVPPTSSNSLSLPFETAARGAGGVPVFPNGPYAIRARATFGDVQQVTPAIQVQVRNP